MHRDGYNLDLDTANASIIQFGLDGTVEAANTHAREVWGRDSGPLVGRKLPEIMPAVADYHLERFGRIAAGRATVVSEEEVPLPGGTRWFSTSIQPLFDGEGTVTSVRVVAFDVTDRRQAEAALRAEEERYRVLFETMTQGVVYLDAEGSITSANPAATRILGLAFDEMRGRAVFDPRWRVISEDGVELPEDELPALVALRTGRPVTNFAMGVLDPRTGEHRWIRVDAVPEFRPGEDRPWQVYAVFSDVTDLHREEERRLELEAQLRRSQKLETIGTLAGGIAHDFNNILAPIVGYTDLALLGIDPGDPVHADLLQVKQGAERARELVQQILLFSRQSERERRPVELQPLVKEALKLLRPSIPSTVTITQRYDPDCGSVMADASQIHQVLVNLCTNAWQAMAAEGGLLGIALEAVTVDAEAARLRPQLAPGRYARLSVSDSGPGLDPAYAERVFEPFFTTKGPDGGTGLGLSVVHGIVRDHGGDVQVESRCGQGAVFRVFLPLCAAALGRERAESGDLQRGNGRILVVDDEQDVAQMVAKMLRRFGYNPQFCTSGEEALQVLGSADDACDLLVTDLTMPGLTGIELGKRARELHPDLPVVLMTGYGGSIGTGELEQCGRCIVIGKPVTVRSLTEAVRTMLGR